MTKLHLISYIAYGSDPTFAAEAVAVENIVDALAEPGRGRRTFRVTETVTATTPAEFRDELETLAIAPERPFITIIDSHGSGETPYYWHLSGYTGARDRVYIRDVANRGVTFKTDILFVIACYSELGLKHWRKIVGEECDIVLSRVAVTHADFTRLFTCFMLATMGKPGRTRIDHTTRKVIWDRAIRSYEILEAGNRTDGIHKHERFEVHHGVTPD